MRRLKRGAVGLVAWQLVSTSLGYFVIRWFGWRTTWMVVTLLAATAIGVFGFYFKRAWGPATKLYELLHRSEV